MKFNKNYWLKKKSTERYFYEQLTKPKESTKETFKIFKKLKIHNLSTIDLACGNGANLIQLKKKLNNDKYCLGIDINKDLLKSGKIYNNFNNLELKFGNIFNLDNKLKNKFELVTSFQTLSFLEDYSNASLQMIKLNSRYIFVSSLFWEGLIDFMIKLNFLKDDSFNRKLSSSFYNNIYSLNNFLNFYRKNGYEPICTKKFNIKKTLKKSFRDFSMGTYTLDNKNKKIQVSGPIIMNWYFIVFQKR